MVYIDSDGVLSDFDQWIRDKTHKNSNSSEDVLRTLIKYQDEAFLASKPIKKNNWLRKMMKTSDFRVLTALPYGDDFRALFNSESAYIDCLDKLKENKYRWFENIGVPRDKVIITSTRREKFNYCKSKDDILYDDFPDTVRTWRDYGGRAYLVKNPKSRAQKDDYELYALKNFDKIKDTIRKGLKRYYLNQCFIKYYPMKDYYDCYEIAELDTNYAIKEIVSTNIFYNPFTGKMCLRGKSRNLLVLTASNKTETLIEYLVHCFPVLFPKIKKNSFYKDNFNDGDTLTNLEMYIPDDYKKSGMSLKKIY